MLGKEEIKRQTIVRGRQNDTPPKCRNSKPKNSVKLNPVLKSKMALMVRQVCFHSHRQLNFILDGGLVQHPQIIKLSVLISF